MGRGESNQGLLTGSPVEPGSRFVFCPACEEAGLGEECVVCHGLGVGPTLAKEIAQALTDGWDAEIIATYQNRGKSYRPCSDCGKFVWKAPHMKQCTECWRASGGSLSPQGHPMPQAAKAYMPLSDKERLLALHNSFTGKVLKRGSVFSEFTGLDDVFGHIQRNRFEELAGDDSQKLIEKGLSEKALYPDHRYLAAPIGNGNLFFLEIGPDNQRGGDSEKLLAVHEALPLGEGDCHGNCAEEYGNFGCPTCRSLRAHHPKTLLEQVQVEAQASASAAPNTCHECGGGGITPECCGAPNGDECCGNAIPGACHNCQGSGVEPLTSPGGIAITASDLPF
jgi:hypothetical protein